MEKIISLDYSEFFKGLSSYPQYPDGGIFYRARNIWPNYYSSFSGIYAQGTMRSGNSASRLDPAVIVDTAIAGVTRTTGTSTVTKYLIGDQGHFYKYDGSTTTDLRSGTPITNPANAVAIFKPQGGTEYLYYWQKTQIGRWDLSGTHPTGWVDNQFTGLQSTSYHPTNTFNGEIYYGNLDRIGKISDSSGTAANTTNVLDFPSDYTATCLADDGTYLIASITKNTGNNYAISDTRIIFWDTFSPSWNKEWVIPETSVVGIKRSSNGLIAVCPNGLWRFDFNNRPKKIKDIIGPKYGMANNVSVINDMVIWATANGAVDIYTYGALLPNTPDALWNPYYQTSTSGVTLDTPKLLLTDNSSTTEPSILFSANDEVLTGQLLGGSGESLLQTIFFSLPEEYKLKRIDFTFGYSPVYGFHNGTSITIQVLDGESGGVNTDWATIDSTSFTDEKFGSTVRTYKQDTDDHTDCIVSSFALKLTGISSDAIKKITVYGEPTNR